MAGNLQSEAFDNVEEETPFEGDMNKQYNADIIAEEESEDDTATSSNDDILQEITQKKFEKISMNSSLSSSMDKISRRNY